MGSSPARAWRNSGPSSRRCAVSNAWRDGDGRGYIELVVVPSLPATPGCLPGPRFAMRSPAAPNLISRRRILVAHEDPSSSSSSSSPCARTATPCSPLVFADTWVDGLPGIELIRMRHTDAPAKPSDHLYEHQPIHPAIEAQLPEDVPVPREPLTADVRAHVPAMLDGDRKQITR
jgi:hypothetical protein